MPRTPAGRARLPPSHTVPARREPRPPRQADSPPRDLRGFLRLSLQHRPYRIGLLFRTFGFVEEGEAELCSSRLPRLLERRRVLRDGVIHLAGEHDILGVFSARVPSVEPVHLARSAHAAVAVRAAALHLAGEL